MANGAANAEPTQSRLGRIDCWLHADIEQIQIHTLFVSVLSGWLPEAKAALAMSLFDHEKGVQ